MQYILLKKTIQLYFTISYNKYIRYYKLKSGENMINEIKRRNVPDFFVQDGKKITSLEQWERKRKELKELFLKEEYGYFPNKIEPSVKVEKYHISFAGKAEWENIYFTFENQGKSHTVKASLILPKGKKNVPVFVSINFEREIPNKYLPTEEIIDTGFGVLAFCYKDVTEDDDHDESRFYVP